MKEKPPCNVCKELQEEPPCGICVPELLPGNKLPMEVFFMVEGQVITRGMDGTVVGLSLPAIKTAMDILGVKDQANCVKKVFATFYELLEKAQNK